MIPLVIRIVRGRGSQEDTERYRTLNIEELVLSSDSSGHKDSKGKGLSRGY